MLRQAYLSCICGIVVAGCAGGFGRSLDHESRVSLPAFAGWYQGERVYYITTEISDATMAAANSITYAPRLRDAVPSYPKSPTERTILERVYKFPGAEQDAVFASVPRPLGPGSVDVAYSPVWLAYLVSWRNPRVRWLLRARIL
jgi:hypothetical protein